jgi:hypothetical protein
MRKLVMVDVKCPKKLSDQILRYGAMISRELSETGRTDDGKARILADLRDYFMYLALRAEKDEADELIQLFEQLERRADRANDQFHAGFFFTLAQLLSLRYEVAMIPTETVSYEKWKRSFRATLRELGISASP